MRIEGLTLGRDWAQPQLDQHILQLLVDEFHSAAKFCLIRGTSLQGALEAIQRGQQRLHRFGYRILTELLLLAGGALPRILELRLQSRQAVEQHITFGFQLVELRVSPLGLAPFPNHLRRLVYSALLARRFGCGPFTLRVQLRGVYVWFSVSCHSTRHSDSFRILSNRRAM